MSVNTATAIDDAEVTPAPEQQSRLVRRLTQLLGPAEISVSAADLEINASDRSGHRLPGSL